LLPVLKDLLWFILLDHSRHH